jgi:hypothetical protein
MIAEKRIRAESERNRFGTEDTGRNNRAGKAYVAAGRFARTARDMKKETRTMSIPRLLPQIEYLGHSRITGKVQSDRGDSIIEQIVDVQAGTAKALRDELKFYPKDAGDADDSYYFEMVDNWRCNLAPDVVKLYDWDGWRIDDMSAYSYIEKISGGSAGQGGHTDDADQVAAILARNRIQLPPGVFPQDLDGISWG